MLKRPDFKRWASWNSVGRETWNCISRASGCLLVSSHGASHSSHAPRHARPARRRCGRFRGWPEPNWIPRWGGTSPGGWGGVHISRHHRGDEGALTYYVITWWELTLLRLRLGADNMGAVTNYFIKWAQLEMPFIRTWRRAQGGASRFQVLWLVEIGLAKTKTKRHQVLVALKNVPLVCRSNV